MEKVGYNNMQSTDTLKEASARVGADGDFGFSLANIPSRKRGIRILKDS
jgi:hypothetical protein